MASLLLKNVTKKHSNGFAAVRDSDLVIEDKEPIIFVGPSGCGKSTTLRMIAGLGDISPGELYIDDKLVNDVGPKDRDIAMVFRNRAPYPYMSVCDNMASRLKLRKASKAEIDEKVHDAVRILDLGHLLDREPKAFSSGQRQRVVMGHIIVRSPKVFLMDEPLSSLDAKLRGQIRMETSKLHQRLETTIIYVTHDQTEVMTPGTRIVIMKDDVAQQVDSPQNLYDKPCNELVAGFIGVPQINMIEAVVGKSGSDITLTSGEHTTALPEGEARKLEGAGYVRKTTVLGVRPEDLYDEESFPAMSSKSVLNTTVYVYEMLGSRVLLYFDIEDADFTAKVNPRATIGSGGTIQLAMNLEGIHTFDKDIELMILNQFL